MLGSGSKKAATVDGGDRISGLPDEVLHRVLWYLPAPEAVRTSVLARRWRPLWKSTRRLGVTVTHPGGSVPTGQGENSVAAIEYLNRFVNRLLLLRDHLPLEECKFSFPGFTSVVGAEVDVWIRHALSCQVPVLLAHLRMNRTNVRVALAEHPLASAHLKRLEFGNVIFRGNFLDFSSCNVLEDLKMDNCIIRVARICSSSLKQLKVTRCNFNFGTITRVSVPSLLYLELAYCEDQTPLLESMPSLERASIELGWFNEDYCGKGVNNRFLKGAHEDDCSEGADEDDCCEGADEDDSSEGADEDDCNEGADEDDCCEGVDADPNGNEDTNIQDDCCSEDPNGNEDTDKDFCGMCAHCHGNDNSNVCLLLGGLSNATYLRLTPSTAMYTIKRDLTCCPTFSNLRTLVIDECCLSAGFYALLRFLQCTPRLKTLILNMQKTVVYECNVEKGNSAIRCKTHYV
ncbi:hypothetical protein BS78_K173000 [Paspalum vaginatum]|uniref:F-box domain-containing protein n=1 Tax=Paspalum vaginatum TaxID=158149 RepID=A0A9W7XBT0_9POAL|nr:hypothetical protein BS78_K173000 [Paspalum vaginatum]